MTHSPRALSASMFLDSFVTSFNSGNADELIEFYAEDAVLNLGAGRVFRGRAAIRNVLSNFQAPRLPIQVERRFESVTDDTGLICFDWRIQGVGPDGAPVNMEGRAVDVLRKTQDGYWRQLLDQPFGAATA